MADRPYRELDSLTPLETARTPAMDRLAGEGQSGFYYPLGPGRVPSTELSHFRLFGYGDHPFPGRACLEALGHGVPCAPGDVFSFLALRRTVREPGGSYHVVGGYGEEFDDAPAGYEELDGWQDARTGYRFEVFYLGGGEAALRIRGSDMEPHPCGEVTDSDPFFFTQLPVLKPLPLQSTDRPEAARQTADALSRFLSRAAEVFEPRSESRESRLVVSKWTGTFAPLPPFQKLTGIRGASVASSRLFRGLSRATGMSFVEAPEKYGLPGKLEPALSSLRSGEAGFVHVHTKAADEASHAGDLGPKVAAIEELDEALLPLLEIDPERMVLCVTSDHCTPVGGRTVHWGDSVPLLVRGPHVRIDGVRRYGERSATSGSLGQIGASNVLPYLLCQADQAHFQGARPSPAAPLGVPASGVPWYPEG